MQKDHHAPWRLDKSKAGGSICPVIYDDSAFSTCKSVYGKNLRLILSTCDFDFLEKYIDRLSAYQSADINISHAVGVFSSVENSENLQAKLNQIKQNLKLDKIIFFVFNSPKLDWVLDKQSDQESQWDYRINFIRNARYNLIPGVWDIFGLSRVNHTINHSSIYVVDYDNVFKGDINAAIKKMYGNKKMVFSWNSSQSPNPNFPETLSGFQPRVDGYKVNHPYKVIKAGFTVFAPCPESRRFLGLYQFYSVGDSLSLIFMRLFTFYFSDQSSFMYC